MTRVFEPLEGRVIDNAGPLNNEAGYLVTRNGRDIVDFSERELKAMLAAVQDAKPPNPHDAIPHRCPEDCPAGTRL